MKEEGEGFEVKEEGAEQEAEVEGAEQEAEVEEKQTVQQVEEQEAERIRAEVSADLDLLFPPTPDLRPRLRNLMTIHQQRRARQSRRRRRSLRIAQSRSRGGA